ncbi:MAG: hypothetical protein VX000_00120 [Myxococcota bacterium]|nr:hypothetical protein [Myxococcota bacterium]
MSPPADLRARVLDAALASASGLALWWLCDRHGLADRILPSGYIAADFVDYCRGLLWMDGADVRWPERRYPAAALPAWMLTHGGGLVEGLRDAASLCTMLLGAALYLWARVAHGRLAGLLAIACACTMAPLVLLPRMLSFYPAMVAGTAFGAAAAMVGLTGPEGRRIGWVGLGAGLVLLLDGRGIVWAAPWLLCGVLAVLLTPGPRARRLAWLLAPVLGSWFVAGALDPGGLLSFEAQVDVRPLYHAAGSTNPAHGPPWADGGAFVWGRSMPWALVDTAGFLFQQLSLEPPEGWDAQVGRFDAAARLRPLHRALLVGVLLAIPGLLVTRRRRHALALAVTAGPYALTLLLQGEQAELFARLLAGSLPGACVLLGVGLAASSELAASGLDRLWPARRWLPGAVMLSLGVLVPTGLVPTPVGPDAGWRRPWPRVSELDRVHPDRPVGVSLPADTATCAAALDADAAAGRWMPALPRR